jgi:REP element-mobilizing transposase RayT
MSRRYRVLDSNKPHFFTITLVEWIHLFDEEEHRNVIIDSLRFAQQNKGLIIHAYVIMPSHFHMIAKAKPGSELWPIIRDLKKYTSKMIVRGILASTVDERKWPLKFFRDACAGLKQYTEYRVWQDGYHGVLIFSDRMFYQKLTYIHNNPVKAKLVKRAEDFEFSSARDYAGSSGLLEITSI